MYNEKMGLKKSITAFLICAALQAASFSALNEPPLEKMIGKMIMTGFRGYEVPQELKEQIRDGKVGGVLILGYNVESLPQVIKLTSDIKKAAGNSPVLIAIDQEGGKVARLKASKGFEDFPSAKEMASSRTTEEAYAYYLRMAAKLMYCGINLNLAPVVDLDIHTDSPAIGKLERSFSSDPATVKEYAEQFILAHKKHGILTCLKHFPGHGSAGDDSHLGITDITKTWSRKELEPYSYFIEKGLADLVMPGHLFNSGIDTTYPASLSKATVQGILREELKYNGVVITDDLQMKAISGPYGLTDTAVAAVNSGSDILLFANYHNYDPDIADKAKKTIITAVADGRIAEEKIKEAFGRISKLLLSLQ